MENTYEGHGNSVSGSSFKKRSWSLAQLSQWPSLLHWRLEMGSSHKWHSTNRGPQHTAKQHERKNQKTTTRPTIRAQVWNGSSRCSHGSISEMKQNYLKNARNLVSVTIWPFKMCQKLIFLQFGILWHWLFNCTKYEWRKMFGMVWKLKEGKI